MSFIINNIELIVFIYAILGLVYITLQAWMFEKLITQVSGMKLLLSYVFWIVSALAFLLLYWVKFVVGFKKGWKNAPKTRPN